jgi:hypothetical protein
MVIQVKYLNSVATKWLWWHFGHHETFQLSTFCIFGCQLFKYLIIDTFHFQLQLDSYDQFNHHKTIMTILGHYLFGTSNQMSMWLSNGDQIGLKLYEVEKMNLGFISLAYFPFWVLYLWSHHYNYYLKPWVTWRG